MIFCRIKKKRETNCPIFFCKMESIIREFEKSNAIIEIAENKYMKEFKTETSTEALKNYFETNFQGKNDFVDEATYSKIEKWRTKANTNRFITLIRNDANPSHADDYLYIRYGQEELFIFDFRRIWLPQSKFDRSLENALLQIIECSEKKEGEECYPNLKYEIVDDYQSRPSSQNLQFECQNLILQVTRALSLVFLYEICVSSYRRARFIFVIQNQDSKLYYLLYIIAKEEILQKMRNLQELGLAPKIEYCYSYNSGKNTKIFFVKTRYYMNINEWIEKNPSQKKFILNKLQESLNKLHAFHIMHNILRPENILIDDKSNVLFSGLSNITFNVKKINRELEYKNLTKLLPIPKEPLVLNVEPYKSTLFDFASMQHKAIQSFLTRSFGYKIHELVPFNSMYTQIIANDELKVEEKSWIIFTSSAQVIKVYASETSVHSLQYEILMHKQFEAKNMAPKLFQHNTWEFENIKVCAFSMEKLMKADLSTKKTQKEIETFFQSMKRYLQRLCKEGFRHFDAHNDNWFVNPTNGEFMLIDFEYATTNQKCSLKDEIRMIGISLYDEFTETLVDEDTGEEEDVVSTFKTFDQKQQDIIMKEMEKLHDELKIGNWRDKQSEDKGKGPSNFLKQYKHSVHFNEDDFLARRISDAQRAKYVQTYWKKLKF